jgi:Leucine-rich repeat (LRR) protein
VTVDILKRYCCYLKSYPTINFTGCKSLKDLPISFTCDQLHTLKLHRVTELTVLPQCITSLSNLEHLDLGHCKMLVELPDGIGNLKRLQVLNWSSMVLNGTEWY